MACCENVGLYIVHSTMPAVNFDFLCDFGSWEMFWLNNTKDTKACIYLHHEGGSSQTFTFCSASYMLHPPSVKWVSVVGEQPSKMWQKMTSSPGSNAKNNRKYRKGRQKYFYVESNHSERFVDWRKSFCSQQRTILLEEILSEFRRKQLHYMSNSALTLKDLSTQIFRNFEIPTISEFSICFKISTLEKLVWELLPAKENLKNVIIFKVKYILFSKFNINKCFFHLRN